MRLVLPAVVVDLNRLPGLDRIEEADGGVRVGALARQSALEASPLARSRCPLAVECLPFVGHFATRNRGTVGGSVAHADASAELPLALVALGGAVVTTRRTVPAEGFFVTHFTTVLEPDELVVATLWPGAGPGAGSAFEEFAPRHGDFALAAAACVLRVEGGRVSAARIAVASVTERPELLDAGLLVGAEVGPELALAAGEAAAASVDPADSLHGSAAYRRRLVAVLVERAVTRAWRNALVAPA